MEPFDVAAEHHEALNVDPFGSMPHWASRIEGLGGPTPAPDPTYVFQTVSVRPATGLVTARVHFHGFHATEGLMLIEVAAVGSIPGIPPSRMRTIEVPLEKLVESNGTIDVLIDAHRNTQYSLSAFLVHGEAAASAISVTFDRRERPGDHGAGWQERAEPLHISAPDGAMVVAWLTSLETPTLSFPRSQPFTERQCREPIYEKWARAMQLPVAVDHRTWAFAYVLEVLDRHSLLTLKAHGIGFVDEYEPIPAVLAANGCQVLAVEHLQPGDLAPDPAITLDRYRDSRICNDETFSNLVYHVMLDIRKVADGLRDSADFVWSITKNRGMSVAQYLAFIHGSINYLRPGGIAVHIFDFEYYKSSEETMFLSRVEVERATLQAMSHQNDVVRLLFRRSEGSSNLVREQTLFGLIIRRGGYKR